MKEARGRGRPSQAKPSQASESKAKQMMNREQGTRVRWKSRAMLESRAVSRGRAGEREGPGRAGRGQAGVLSAYESLRPAVFAPPLILSLSSLSLLCSALLFLLV